MAVSLASAEMRPSCFSDPAFSAAMRSAQAPRAPVVLLLLAGLDSVRTFPSPSGPVFSSAPPKFTPCECFFLATHDYCSIAALASLVPTASKPRISRPAPRATTSLGRTDMLRVLCKGDYARATSQHVDQRCRPRSIHSTASNETDSSTVLCDRRMPQPRHNSGRSSL